MPILKWIEKNWLGVVTAIGILYGMGMSTYNFFVSRCTKKRRLRVTITRGDKNDGRELMRGDDLLFINVINPGYIPVTINKPYFEMPEDTTYEPPGLLSDVSFPYGLLAGQRCRAWMKETDVAEYYTKACGLKGEVRLRGMVQDETEKVWKSKKWCQDKTKTKGLKKFAKRYFKDTPLEKMRR